MSSTVSSTTSSYSSTNRVTGMVSGLDVDSIVESLMDAEEVKLDKIKQKKEVAEWKQDAYRDVSNELRAFSDKYFSYSTSSTNMLSASTYQQFSTASSDESVVSITASSDAEAGSHTVVVTKLATSASYKSTNSITGPIAASTALTDTTAANAAGKSFVLTIDGVESTITIGSSITNVDDLKTAIQSAIDTAVGSGKITVSVTDNKLTIAEVDGSGIGTIAVSAADTNSALTSLGFADTDNLKNYLDTTATLKSISSSLDSAFTFGDGTDSDTDADDISFKINGVSFSFSADTTLKAMMKEINASDAGVTIKYSTTSDAFTITSNDTGAGQKITMSDSVGNFLETLGFTKSENYTAGGDAEVVIDGEKLVRSTNLVTQDGITYKLLAESTETQNVSVTQDTDGIYDMIESFVNDYNALIESLNSKIAEEYDRDYQPLTDDEKDEMSDDDIDAWEEKAKTGLLENDSIIENLLSNMRMTLYESVGGVSTHLTSIGITTSSDYEDQGKLEIDEDELREAIEANPEGVMNLFSKESESYSGTSTVVNLTSSQRKVRTSEEGLAYKLYDILQDNISTYTGIDGNKGFLIEKAGIEDDGSQYENTISDQIDKYEDEIEEMEDKLEDKEDYYYEKYSAMETYINQMNSQLTSLQSMLG